MNEKKKLEDYLFYQDDWATIYCGDCLEIMPLMKPENVDLVVTDPPYFLPATHYQASAWYSRNFSDLGILEHFFKDFFKILCSKIRSSATIYMFCDGQSYPLFYYYLYPFCKSMRPLVWDKGRKLIGYGWRHQHELIIFAEMPKSRPIETCDGDILRFSMVPHKEKKHPAAKPSELVNALINKSALEGCVVFDPFLGSGTTCVVAKRVKIKSIGIETSKKYCEIAVERLIKSVSIGEDGKVDRRKVLKKVGFLY